MKHSKLSYRAEIDGLRAIAVVSVILYHAQMVFFGRDWFEGGFIGVDIFFVISGYLITRIILSELQTKGSFSFLNFYERRARRILPMLFVIIFVSIPYAWQKLLPSDFVEYAESVLASLFFSSNFFFYFSTTEYGADSALLKPFLHTWSLGVEEQFYLVFPILAILAFKYFRMHFLTILVGLSLLTLQFAELMEVRNSGLNFYLPFSRFWEFAVGSMLAYRELYYKAQNEDFASKSLPIIGLYLIAYSILFFDAKIPHPSFYTLIPIIGVALIIGFASKDELVGKALGSKPFVWVGLISYSAYLWHFPIFAISRQTSMSHTNYDKFEWIAATIVLSIISFIIIETPIRNTRKVGKKLFFSLIFSSFVLAGIICVLIIKGTVVNPKWAYLDKLIDNGPFGEEDARFEINYDYSVLNDGKPNILIVGNSHAEDLLKVLSFSYMANEYHLNLTSPIRRTQDMNYQVRCFWPYLKTNDTTCDENEYGPNISKQYSSSNIIMLATRWTDADINTLSLSIPKMLNDGKIVIVVGNTPESKTFGEKQLNRFDKFIFERYKLPSSSQLKKLEQQFFDDYMKGQRPTNSRLSYIVDSFNNPNVVFRVRSDFMCEKDEKRCYMYFPQDKAKVLWDYSHITTNGARVLGRLITEKQWLSDLVFK